MTDGKQWAFVDWWEGDELRGELRLVDVEPRPFASDPFGEEFREKRTKARVSLRIIALAIGLTSAEVSAVERGATGLQPWEKTRWWTVLDETIKDGWGIQP